MTAGASRASSARLLLLVPVLAGGMWTLLASSTFEEEDPPPPAEVDFSLSSRNAPIVVDDGIVFAESLNLRIAGTWRADAGDALTVARDGLLIDDTSGFGIDVTGLDGDDELQASAEVDVTLAISTDFDEDPDAGRFTVTEAGTTTVVSLAAGGVSLEVGTGPALGLDWDDFRDAARDENQDEPVRVASAAWLELPRVLRLARIGEDLVTTVEDNARMLEGMNLNEPLDLTCDNTGGERVLLWRRDAPGAGQGSVGAGDSFETRFRNCRDDTIGRFLEGTIVLDDYAPVSTPDRSLGGTFSYAALFVSEEEIGIGTVPSETSPRVSGTLVLRYDERVLETPEE